MPGISANASLPAAFTELVGDSGFDLARYGREMRQRDVDRWRERLEEYGLPPQNLRVVENAGHYVHWDEPEVVVDAIQTLAGDIAGAISPR